MSTMPRNYKVIFSDNQEFEVTSFDAYDALMSAGVKYQHKNPGEDFPDPKEVIALNSNIENAADIIDRLTNLAKKL